MNNNNNQIIENNSYSYYANNNSNYNNISNDEELIKAYIGKNSDKIYPKIVNSDNLMKNFDIFAFLFTDLYFLYRKMYLNVFILLILSFVTSIILGVYSSLIYNFLCGFLFIPLYKKHIEKKIKKYKSKTSSYQELLEKCKKKGGTIVKHPVAITIISIILFLVLSFIFTLLIVASISK